MASGRPSFLLVDGNNVIHSWSNLVSLHRKRRGTAHTELIKILESHQDFSEERVVVVFDGTGSKNQDIREPGSVQVIYSQSGTTADAIIERLACSYAETYDITVATDDVAEQDAVVAAGGHVISVDELRHRVESSHDDMRRWLRSRR